MKPAPTNGFKAIVRGAAPTNTLGGFMREGAVAAWCFMIFMLCAIAASAQAALPASLVSPAYNFNGDGKSDILWRNTVTGETYIYLMNGLTLLPGGYLPTVATAWVVAGTGDYDGDGKTDILWRNGSTGDNYIYLMDALTVKPASGYITSVPLNWLPMPNQPPLIALTAPADNSVATAGAQITLTAQASPGNAGRSISQVQFFTSLNGAASVNAGIVTAGAGVTNTYSINWIPTQPGSYSLTARATDDMPSMASVC